MCEVMPATKAKVLAQFLLAIAMMLICARIVFAMCKELGETVSVLVIRETGEPLGRYERDESMGAGHDHARRAPDRSRDQGQSE